MAQKYHTVIRMGVCFADIGTRTRESIYTGSFNSASGRSVHRVPNRVLRGWLGRGVLVKNKRFVWETLRVGQSVPHPDFQRFARTVRRYLEGPAPPFPANFWGSGGPGRGSTFCLVIVSKSGGVWRVAAPQGRAKFNPKARC